MKTMNNYELFNKNVVLFKKYEIESARRIKAKYNVDVKKWCDNSNYDFKTTDNIKYEVKTEPASLKTFNCFIEYFAYGVPSGISVTTANYYIITDTIDYYLIETKILKELCQKYNNIKKTNDNLTSGYLLKKNIIVENSILI
jgi:hypothetical protein